MWDRLLSPSYRGSGDFSAELPVSCTENSRGAVLGVAAHPGVGSWVIQLLRRPSYSCREPLPHAAVSLINSFVCQTRLGWTCSFVVGTLCDLNRCLPISPWKSSTAVWLVFLYRVYNGEQNTHSLVTNYYSSGKYFLKWLLCLIIKKMDYQGGKVGGTQKSTFKGHTSSPQAWSVAFQCTDLFHIFRRTCVFFPLSICTISRDRKG